MKRSLLMAGILLCSCSPILVATDKQKADPLKFTIQPFDEYMAISIDSGIEPVLNVILKFSGNSIRFNDSKCKVINQDITCSLGNINTYTLPFLGTILDGKLTYYRKDGMLYHKDLI